MATTPGHAILAIVAHLFICSCVAYPLQAGADDTTNIVIRHSDGAASVIYNGDTCTACVRGNRILVAPSIVFVTVEQTLVSVYEYGLSGTNADTRRVSANGYTEGTHGPYSIAVPTRDSVPGLFDFPRQRRLDSLQQRLTRLDTLFARIQRRGEVPNEEQVQRRTRAVSAFKSLDARRQDFSRYIQRHEQFGRSLESIDKLLYSNSGLLQIRTEALNTLQKYYGKPEVANDAHAIHGRLRAQMTGDSLTLRSVATVMTVFSQLRGHLSYYFTLEDRLETDIKLLSKRERAVLDSVRKRALLALNDFDKIVALAYDTEAVAVAAVKGANEWRRQVPEQLSLLPGAEVYLRIRPSENRHLVRMANLPARAYSIVIGRAPVVSSGLPIQPGIGLSFVFSPGSEFATFGVRQNEAQFEIVSNEAAQDSRFTWGINVGLTYSFLDWRAENGLAVWLPELTVNPSNDVNAIALGAGVSFLEYLKLGFGMLWTKHQELDKQQVGDLLDGALDLRVRNTFGGFGEGSFYIGLSVFGWPSGL